MTAISASNLLQGKVQFCDGNGQPYANATVGFYIPSTLTPMTTWVDPYQSVPNANPVPLDAAGRAVIFGSGLYRQILVDQFGTQIWDTLVLAGYPAAPTFSGTVTFADGSVFGGNGLSTSSVISALGGIEFSPSGATLSDYEIGTWTPTDASGTGLTFLSAAGNYVRIGALVFVEGVVSYPVTADGANAKIGALPFACGVNSYAGGGNIFSTSADVATPLMVPGTATFSFINQAGAAAFTNTNLSGTEIKFGFCYQIAS